jgi:hypothetical protein
LEVRRCFQCSAGKSKNVRKRIGVLLQRRDCLWVLRAVLGAEPSDRFARLGARLGVHDLVERRLRTRLEPAGKRVEDVAELVEPVPLRAGLGPTSRSAAQNPRAPSPTATTGARIPHRFRSRSTAFQLSALSR